MTVSRIDFELEYEWILDQQKAYLEAREEHRQRGHRHPYCFHGTYQWVDYDVMCPGCEDSLPDEHTSPEDVRASMNERYDTAYGEDHLLWQFHPIPWGPDEVYVVAIHHYEAQRIEGKMTPPIDCHNAFCTLALESDGDEFEMVLGTDELIAIAPEVGLDNERIKEFNDINR